ncbi:SsgA family sporulation/cell division regulator [Streptomyces longispororuber]|uniref:SsgA family sporulation/cell division regulator n=1 Tax=Streptomyces longispororuber TaxID=68230 RepID=UPI00210BF512|nr:SsgA family sporulation/cell division regulator [Streptomyces longispororuber]MCQ4212780.1 SsgA family sporulation/cell division regulator [Streptomyces longispororuber]
MPTTLPVTLEQSARARLVTAEGQGPERSITVTLRYASGDPLAIHVAFPAEATLAGTEVTWAFARTLLDEGLRAPTGSGDVHVWPCGRARTVVELHAPEGMAVVQFDTAVLRRFLTRSYALVPAGDEDVAAVVDHALATLFGHDGGHTGHGGHA